MNRENFRFPAAFAFLAGVFALIAPVISGFSADGLALLPQAALYLIFGYLLILGRRILGWLGFFVLFAALIWALTWIWAPSPVPSWVFLGVFGCNALAVLGLFVGLWRAPPVAEEV
ncbi:MAG: hypothetical protein OIF48_16390 [Silicimonas sp.]|nr:hypothetical protein [Silicimonas sp.]